MDNPTQKWGLPDWENLSTYGDIHSWNMSRWRWEFVRRHSDYRDEYRNAAEATYKYLTDMEDLYEPEPVPSPTHRDFIAMPELRPELVTGSSIQFGYDGLPNPTYSEHPEARIMSVRDNWKWRTINYDDAHEAIWGDSLDVETFLPDGYVAIRFDLTSPLAPQIRGLKDELEQQRKFFFSIEGKTPTPRARLDRWPLYLRVLDAREYGASWNKISTILPNIMTNKSAQAARNVFEQADALRDNFTFNPQF